MDTQTELARIATGGPFDTTEAIRLLAQALLALSPPTTPPTPKPTKTKTS